MFSLYSLFNQKNKENDIKNEEENKNIKLEIEDSSFYCEFCNKSFTTIYSLNIHKKTTKKCLIIQEKNNLETYTNKFICECGKEFNLNSSLSKHKKICKIIIKKIQTETINKEELKQLISNEKDIEYMKKEIEELKIRNNKLEEKYEREINDYKREIDDYKRQINNYLNKEASRVDSSLDRSINVVNNT